VKKNLKNSGCVVMLMLILLSGCATNVQVKGEFPTPLSVPLPVHAGLVLDEKFRTHVYSNEENRKLTFAIGEAQSAMYRTLVAGMFTRMTELDSRPATPATDITLVPSVEEIQVARPFETSLKVFEVWLKYNISVYDSKGEPIADWIMTAYGKTPTRFLTSDEDALNQAAIVALRDAGARLVIEFARVPEISQWLQAHSARQATAHTVDPAVVAGISR